MQDTAEDAKFAAWLDGKIHAGSLAVAQRQTHICSPGEVGVCYDVQRIGGEPVYFFIFERGGYDGFDAEEVGAMLELTGWTCEALTGYRFANVSQVERDYRAGVFAPAFPSAPRGDPAARPGSADARP